MQQKNTGFTLIELLVVVLIIGILAAVALPQYQKAVIKARIGTILPVLASLTTSQEIYFLANEQYTSDARNLDIETPANCLIVGTNGHFWKCGKYWLISIGNEEGHTIINYCPNNNESYDSCAAQRDFQLYRYPKSNIIYCDYRTTLGKKICSEYDSISN